MKKYSTTDLVLIAGVMIFIGFFWGVGTNKSSVSEIEKALFDIHCPEQKKEMEKERYLECKISYKGWKFIIQDGKITLKKS